MNKSVYIESSVISYLTARRSRDLVIAGHQAVTAEWLDEHRLRYDVYVLPLAVEEISAGDASAAEGHLRAIADIPSVAITAEAESFAFALLASNAVPANSVRDALHIAIAATQGIDYLITWNFGHINNARTRIMDCVWGALAQAVPELVFASTEGGTTIYSFGGYDEARNPSVFVEVFGGSWGGRPDRDGIDGISHPALNQRNIPAEHIEMEHPVELVRYGFVPDTGGAGKFRGGVSLVRDIRYLGKVPAQLQVRSDRCDHMPWGLAGGKDGTPSYNLLNPGTAAERRLQAMDTTTIRPGEIVRFVCSSAGGWGDPLERDPRAVAADVREGRLSAAYVHEHYALAFSEEGELDEAETGLLRARRRLS